MMFNNSNSFIKSLKRLSKVVALLIALQRAQKSFVFNTPGLYEVLLLK